MAVELLKIILNEVEERVNAGDVFDSVNYSAIELAKLRLTTDDASWISTYKPAIQDHNLFTIFQQDPYTNRAKEKPRGYAGDAVMLDYLYFANPPADTTPLGVEIFKCTIVSPGGLAVKWRAQKLGEEIDALAATKSDARVLSLACGHLREVEFSEAIKSGSLSVIYAVDQDADSLSVVKQDYGHLHVELKMATVKDVMKGTCSFTDLDLAYAAGLYDYLPEPVAQALTARLFAMLAPGGKLIVPNFLSDNPVRGYMESFMDWHLIVRDRAEIERIGATIPDSEVAERRYFEDPFGVVGYLELTKSGLPTS